MGFSLTVPRAVVYTQHTLFYVPKAFLGSKCSGIHP